MFGGGVIIYSSTRVAVIRRIDLEFDDDEIIWIQIHLNQTKYILVVLYRP